MTPQQLVWAAFSLGAATGALVTWARLNWNLRYGKPKRTGLILKASGDTSQLKKFAEPQIDNGNTYAPHPERKFWLDEPLPKGWVWLYPENHPHPIATDGSAPKQGFSGREVSILVGDWWIHVFGGAKRPGFQLTAKNVLLVLAGLALLGAAFYYYTQKVQGG